MIDEEMTLIPLIVRYTKKLGLLFPIDKVKHLSNDILIDRIKYCIDNNIKYNPDIFYLENVQKMSENDLEKVVPLVLETFQTIGYNYKIDLEEFQIKIKEREDGKKFRFNEHLEALIITQLSNHRWGDSNIKENKAKIRVIFHNFSREYLKYVDTDRVVKSLKDIHCSNPTFRKQIEAIPYNVEILERIEKKYSSLDNYVLNTSPIDIARSFDTGEYQLK